MYGSEESSAAEVFFFLFWLVRFTFHQFKRLAFTLSPAAAGALPEGEPWGESLLSESACCANCFTPSEKNADAFASALDKT